MDDSARGDDPAEPKRPGPAEAETPVARREPVADVIPTVAPRAPRTPAQTPPWLGETVSADTADDAQTGQEDVPEVTPEASVAPIDPELFRHPIAEAAYDFSNDKRRTVDDAAPDAPLEPVVPGPPVHRADVDQDTDAAEPEPQAAAEPAAEELSATADDTMPGRAEADVSNAIVSEPILPEPSPAPLVSLEAESEAAQPAAVDVDVPSESPSEGHLAQPDAPSVEAPVSDKLVWRDGFEDRQSAEAPEAEAVAPGMDAALPPDEQPVPVREDQIWSGPDAVEANERRIEPEPAAAEPEPHAERDARAEPEPPAEEHTPYRAITPSTALSLPAIPSSFTPAWPSTSVPAPGRAGETVPYVRLAIRIVGGVALALTATVLLLVVLYRWVDPPASTLMLGQRLAGTEIHQKWMPIDRISPNLIQAVILSEDGGFCRHRGVDLSALGEAIESSRGGSTITMQVVKNLFLWPARSYIRKALEIVLAYTVELVWPKERVLEIYLNIAEWGPGVFGAEAAARNHFGKPASQLTAPEAALLAVSLPSPIERQAGYPDQQTRRLASNLQLRMRAVRTAQRCVRTRRAGS